MHDVVLHCPSSQLHHHVIVIVIIVHNHRHRQVSPTKVFTSSAHAANLIVPTASHMQATHKSDQATSSHTQVRSSHIKPHQATR
jgi:hypothetical protein